MISIVIIVKNDKRIEKLLKHLEKIPKPEKSETIVVDASEGSLDYIKEKFPYARWYNFLNKTNKRYTYAEQRNLGIRKAKGDIIVFIDSDAIPTKNWLKEIIKSIKQDKENFVAGRVKSLGKKTFNDITWEKRKRGYIPECGALNLAFRKNIINIVGIFDENLEEGEDLDFTWRIIKSGYRIKYEPKIIVYHDWGDGNISLSRAFRYGTAKTKLYRKHSDRLLNLIGRDFVLLAYPLYILLLPLTFVCPYYPLVILIPVLKNIKNHPFRTTITNLVKGLGILTEFFAPKKYKIVK